MQGIALIGEPGSGKSSIAQALCDILGWQKISFAGPLKDEVAKILDYSDGRITHPHYRSEMDDPAVKDKYRLILQWWGTEFRRGQDPNYWVTQLIQDLNQVTGRYVVDDTRFNNEYEALKLLGFKVVLLQSGETTREVPTHASEVDWKKWPVDLSLNWEAGPQHQAERLITLLKLEPIKSGV